MLGDSALLLAPSTYTRHQARLAPTPAQPWRSISHTLGSRGALAAGALPKSLGALEGWVGNAPAIQPGTQMPKIVDYDGRELRALAAYVYSLK